MRVVIGVICFALVLGGMVMAWGLVSAVLQLIAAGFRQAFGFEIFLLLAVVPVLIVGKLVVDLMRERG